MEIRERLKKEMIFKLSDTTISSRLYNYWEKIGIVNDTRPGGKGWRYFTIVDILWIEIVSELTLFGFDSSKIKKTKTCLESTSRLDIFISSHLNNKWRAELIVMQDGTAILDAMASIYGAKEKNKIKESYISIDLQSIIKKVKNNIKND